MSSVGKRLNPIQHILQRPDMYIGDVRTCEKSMYILSDDRKSFVLKPITLNLGIYHIIKEILSNAVDNIWTEGSEQTFISCIIDESGRITVRNDGRPIPVVLSDYRYIDHITGVETVDSMYPAEMFFGYLHSGTNFDDTEKRKKSGRNGIGSKATCIFSKSFRIDHADGKRRLIVEYNDNLSIRSKPVINDSIDIYTEISFVPDYDRFYCIDNTDQIPDITGLADALEKLCYDYSMVTDIKIIFKKFSQRKRDIVITTEKYLEMMYGKCKTKTIKSKDTVFILVDNKDRKERESVSFVNGLYLSKGVHVDIWNESIYRQLTRGINKILVSKNIKTTGKLLQSFTSIFLRCELDNPQFDTQTKTNLTSPVPDIVKMTDTDIEEISTWPFFKIMVEHLSAIKNETDNKKVASIEKSSSRKKVITGTNFIDASGAGKIKGCTLWLTEGLSAMALVVSMCPSLDGSQNKNGILGLKGKTLNILKASDESIALNKEFQLIQQAIGLDPSIDYSIDSNMKKLRYSRVNLFMDSDEDGIHIRGLVLNMFYNRFPTLWNTDFVFCSDYTPVVKLYVKNIEKHSFYSLEDYKTFVKKNDKRFTIRYFKGLGTTGKKDGETLAKNRKTITFSLDGQEDKITELAFGKDSDDRKKWILDILKDGNGLKELVYNGRLYVSKFISDQLLHYWLKTLRRSIPNLYDGLKEGQRKILYTVLKKRYTKLIKVSTLTGSVQEIAEYHHGSASLEDTIIKMAQEYVGSNNIPILHEDGQFGSRLHCGKDASQARYLFTHLSSLARIIFDERDEPILNYIETEGVSVEPDTYYPIIPLCLVNGIDGIATGFSTTIPCFNPKDIIDSILQRLKLLQNHVELVLSRSANFLDSSIILKESERYIKDNDSVYLTPWWKGFTGRIEEYVTDEGSSYHVTTIGVLDIIDTVKNRWKITEIPIGRSIMDIKNELEKLLEPMVTFTGRGTNRKETIVDPVVIDIEQYHTIDTIEFHITFKKDFTPTIDNLPFLKKNINMKNMYLLVDGTPTRFKNAQSIIDYFIPKRLEMYKRRIDYEIADLEKQKSILDNKIRYIDGVVAYIKRDTEYKDTIIDISMDEKDVIELLTINNFISINKNFSYLLDISTRTCTRDVSNTMRKKLITIIDRLTSIHSRSIYDIWREELLSLYPLL